MANVKDIRRVIKAEKCACVFVDDSGSQGQAQGLPHMPDDRFSWVGVVVPPKKGEYVFEQMDGCLELIRNTINADEFHFSEIYNGKGAWKNVRLENRLGIFSVFSNVIAAEKFSVFNQTLWENHYVVKEFAKKFPVVAGKKLSDPKICSLVILMIKIRRFLEKQKWLEAVIVIDEGIQKSGSIIQCPGLSPTFRNGEVTFSCSKEVFPLQLADLAAYALNRSQVIIGKKKRLGSISVTDAKFCEAVGPLMDCYDKTKKIHFDVLFKAQGS